jgi:two-component system OmpR family response regulator
MKWTLVYFDDQVQNIEAFKELLSEKFEVIGCNDVTSFPRILEEYNPHAFLLDVHMPIMDGHTLYKNISEHPLYNGCPVIFISGDQSDENRLKSYNEGAVDFLPRDIKTEEIILRLTNKIKFYLQMSTSLELGNMNIDVRTMKSEIAGKNIDLTLLELRMLSHIMRTFPGSLTRTELIEKVWGTTSVKPGTINTHLTNLKPKIESWSHLIKVRDENVLVQKK